MVSHGDAHHSHTLRFDHLVLGLGSVTHTYELPGVAEHALTMKSLGDANISKNRMIAALEEANLNVLRKTAVHCLPCGCWRRICGS